MQRRLASVLVLVVVAALLPGCVYITRASESSTGAQGNSFSVSPSISADGRWVAFSSWATNLVPGDTNGVSDVFVRDNLTKTVVRVSIGANGTQADGHSAFPSISDDGRVVAFTSEATNLRSGDTNGLQDIYFHDRDRDGNGVFDEPGGVITELFSFSNVAPGFPTGGISERPKINGNGLGVVYETTAALVSEDTNGLKDVYSTQLVGGLPFTRLISKPAGGGVANGLSDWPTVNFDGTVVAFETAATNLVAGDTNGLLDVVVWDAHSSPPAVTRATGAVQADADLIFPSLSHDTAGRFVVFSSAATNLGVLSKTNTFPEIYLLDRTTGAITSEGRYPFEEPNGGSFFATVSADGARVSFQSSASNLVLNDNNGQTDIFVRDRPSDLIQVASTAKGLEPADGGSPTSAISADGNYIAFESRATNLITPDANGDLDVFTRGAIVPQIDTIKRVMGSFQGMVHAPNLAWGANTVRITGQGFGPNVSVDLGAGVTVNNIQRTPTQLDLQVTVANGASGTRNVSVKAPATAGVAGGSTDQLCIGCVSIQRWATSPDPVPFAFPIIVLTSNNEFTAATTATGFTVSFDTPSTIFLLPVQPFPAPGTHDITLQQTVNGTVTCAGCLHVS